ncbi:hypothetical protein EXM22_11720 [Oceanispirochaeta crateris]|uniref:PAS domain-containing protein n=1 Tax=Oceanispirochaeta crateris TaxID=2518645 RepID=A0A5C1QN17_9SPIO|nr:hypothetical protein [Oceanispirochaeta crateris]QEN08619.1 hypothetical protein EXM22_11720 [Oceanispirochaeta crateris]
MIVISAKRLIISFLLILTSTVVLLMTSINLFSTTSLNLSLDKQEVLFWGIVIIIAQTIVAVMVFVGHQNLIANLNKIISYKDLNHPQSIKILKRLGNFGQILDKMLKELNDLLDLRMNRITASNKVMKLICEEYPTALVISDTLGTILGASNKMKEKANLPIKADTKIMDLFPQIKLAEVLVSLEKNRTLWKDEENTGYVCTPVFDKGGHLNLCIWELETGHFIQKLSSNSAGTLSRKTFQSVRGLFKKRPSKDETAIKQPPES